MSDDKAESEPPYLLEGTSTLLNDIILEIEDNVEYPSAVDVRYLNSIKDKIKSCIYCGENECPKIRQRLDRHITDHHSSTSNNRQRYSQSRTSSYSSRNSSLTSDGQTSTTDILKDMKKYKRLLRSEILEWAKDIPIYSDQITESKKQNLVNKYVDKVNDMFGDIYEEKYNSNLRNKTDMFLNTLPGLGTLKEELRENILKRINQLNRKFNKTSYRNKQKALDKPEVKEIATSTLIDKLLDSTKRQHISTNTVQEYYNEVIGSDIPYTNLSENRRTSNATVQADPTLNNIFMYEDNSQFEQDEFKEIKILFKHKVLEWMKNIMGNENYKFVNTNVDKNFISNILWDQLKQFLIKKSPGRTDKLVLKIKILDMIDSLPLSTAMLDPTYRDIIADDLNSRLQSVQDSQEMSIQSLNKMMLQNRREIVRNVFSPTSERAQCSALSQTLSVFKSEQKSNLSQNSTLKEKSTVNVSNPELIKLNSDEIMYINKIVETIISWLNTLPKEFKNDEQKYDNIKYLAREIYDQTTLEEGGDITSIESDKFKAFIIRKWLNRFDFFDNANDSKPYIDRLVKDLREIVKSHLERAEEPVKICCGQKPRAFEPELIMKNLILKFLEYTYSEDNVATRYLFAHLLKSELPNLCLPSRKEVYDSLEQYVTGGVLSFKKLDKELQYIMIISDLLREVPLADNFTSKNRVEFINKLAENIYVVEQNVQGSSEADLQMVIRRFVEELPITILTDYNEIVNAIIDDLVNNIVRLRNAPPCCLFANSDRVNSPMDSKTLSDFIESFIRDNNKSLLENELKLEACSFRLVKEINKMITENPEAFNTNEVYKRLTNNTLLGDETVRRFSTELNYAKEISDWLNNLPLLPIKDTNDADIRTKKISDLVHKMAEYQENKRLEPHNSNVIANFKDYLEKWLLSFPLDSRKNIIVPVVTQQLLNRIERVNKEQQKKKELVKTNIKENTICQTPGPCCSYSNNYTQKKQDPARSIVETIEQWCSNLPIEGDFNNVSRVKESIATKLYQKLGDINANPDCQHSDNLFKEALAQEINSVLDNIPNNTKLNDGNFMKERLIKSIMAQNKLIKEKISGSQYKQRLENTIALSIPHPVNSCEDDPGFELYKDRLSTLFILDNFDYSNNSVKLKYEKILRDEIDKYSSHALKRSNVPISKDKMYNELYSTLFRIPIPNEDSISDIVEEIKTRCEIAIWFEKLPLKKSTSLGEVLDWDKILTMLAKKLHDIESLGSCSDDKMHKEIVKCLRRLPLMPGKEAFVDQFASELQARLKSTFAMRKCVSQVDISIFIDKIQAHRTPNYEEQTQTPLPECCKIRPNLTKKPADLIIDIVESWCKALPIPANTQEEIDNVNSFKDNIVIKIIIKISELNMNPGIFEDDSQYNALLDDELENIFATLPPCCNYMQNKEIFKQQLINEINSVKPQIKEENSRHKYKQELKSVVSNVLEKPPEDDRNPAVLNDIKNEIVDSFVVYYYYKEDINGKQVYKTMINDAVAKYLSNEQDDAKECLMKSNQLVCELCKVPSPNEHVLMDEVEEIRMKFEVTEFLDDLPLSINDENKPIKNQIKSTLARRLSDLEKSGHSNEVEAKMKEEVKKCLNKINESIDTETIESFIERLRNSEASRKSHPAQLYPNSINNSPQYNHTNSGSYTTPPIFNASFQTPQVYEPPPSVSFRSNNQSIDNNQWMSLLPATPLNQMVQNSNLQSIPTNQNEARPLYADQTSGNDDFNRVSAFNGNSCRPCDPYGSRNNYYTEASNANDLASIQNSIQDNQMSNQSYQSREFEAGIRVTSTPNQNAMLDGSLSCQLYGRSQNRSLSHQSYRRPAEANNRPVPYPSPEDNQSYENQFRPALQYTQDDFSKRYPGNDINSTQGRPFNQYSQQHFEPVSQRDYQFDGERQEQFSACNKPLIRCPNAQVPCISAIPLSPGSNNRQVPSIAIPSSCRSPCLSANQQKASYKPCRRPSPPQMEDESESCLRRMAKSHKQTRSSENQVSDDEENCVCRKKRNPKSVCVQMKKYCKICRNLDSYYSTLPNTRYPGFYYY